MHLCMCSEFYSSQRFSWRCWFIAFCRAFLSLPSLLVVLVCYRLGLGLGLGIEDLERVRVRVSSMSSLLIMFSTELLVSV